MRRASGRAGAAVRRADRGPPLPGPSTGPELGIGREGVGVEPACDCPQVQPGPADEDRDASRCRSRERRSACGRSRPPRTARRGRQGRARGAGCGPLGSRHLGRADVQAAEHLPRVGRDDLGGLLAGIHSASQIESPVLPVAVAPAMTRSGGAAVFTRRRACPKRVRPGVLDADADEPPDQVGRAPQVDELVAAVRPDRAEPSASPSVRRGGRVFVLVAAGRNDRVDEDLDSRSSHARLRSSPIDSWSASSSFRRPASRPGARRRRASSPGSRAARRTRPRTPGRSGPARGGAAWLRTARGSRRRTHDHVGRDRDPGHGRADRSEPLEIVLNRVLAAHPAQDRVVARLDRQMEVLAHGSALGDRRDQAVRQIPRVRGHEAQPRNRRTSIPAPERIDRADQLGEVRPPVEVELATGPPLRVDVREARLGRQVVAVRVDVLAEERDLPIAGGGQRPGLVDDLVERAAALGAAAERHDAVRACLVAAVDDRQPGVIADPRATVPSATARARVPARWSATPTTVRPTPRSRPPRRSAPVRTPAPAVDELRLLVGPQEQVHRRVAAAEPVAMRLADRTPGQHDAEPGVRLLQVPGGPADRSPSARPPRGSRTY